VVAASAAKVADKTIVRIRVLITLR